jgi:hypothetical protein
MEQKTYHEWFVSSYIEQNSHTNIKRVTISTQIVITIKHRERESALNFHFRITSRH